MISLFAARSAGRVSRRDLFRLGAAGLGFSSLGMATAAPAASGTVGTAKGCIYLFLCGGPSQLDLWDPKPDAPEGIRSVFKPIETSAPGIRFTELLPKLSRHADKLALIRSMTHDSPDHNFGIAHTLSGLKPNRPDDVFVSAGDHPALGAILHKLRGEEGLLPPWVILPRPFTTLSPPHKGQSAGFLGPSYDPVALNEPAIHSLGPKELRFGAFELPPELGHGRLAARRGLLGAAESAGPASSAHRVGDRWGTILDKAAVMLESETCRRAFDLSLEDPRIRDRYGRNEYGQSLLLARRLVEAGVRFVNVFWTFFDDKGCQFNLWDNHGVATDVCGVGGARTGLDMLTHEYCTPSFDRSFTALLEDMQLRGLLDETLVAVAGDFGRTPRINALAGRDHWPHVYTQLLAGGGVRGGQVYGASDRNAGYVKDHPVRPEDFHATILHAFGIDPDTTILDPLERPIRITEGSPVRELFG